MSSVLDSPAQASSIAGSTATRPRPEPRRRHPALARRGRQFGVVAIVVALGFLVLSPLVRLQSRALEDNGASYRRVVDNPRFADVLWTTVYLAFGSVVVALGLGTMLAWAASRLSPRLRWLAALPMLPLVMPTVASITGWTFLLAPRAGYINQLLRETPLFDHLDSGPIDVFTTLWIVLLTGFSLTSFVYLFVYTAIRSMNQDFGEAAATCGAKPTREFLKVTLPLLRPSLVYATGIVLLFGLGQFAAPLLLGTRSNIRVLTTEMFYYTQAYPTDFGAAAALGSPLIVAGLILVVLQRRVIGDRQRFETIGGKSMRFDSRSSRWAAAPIVIYGIVALILPLLALIAVAFSKFWTGDLSIQFTTEHFETVLIHDSRTRGAIWTSIITSLMALAIVLPLGLAAAVLMVSRTQRGVTRGIVEFFVTTPLGIPAVLFGAAILFTYTEPPLILYGTTWVIVVAYVTIMIPHSARLQLSAISAVSSELTEAARVSGAGPFLTLRVITIPLIRRGIASAAAVVVIVLMHEFSASLFVRSANTEVMGSVLYDYWATGLYPQVAVLALVMCAITAVAGTIALSFGGGSGSRRTRAVDAHDQANVPEAPVR